MIYLRLFYEFFKTGLFLFGGGLASIPFLQEMADNTGLFTQKELAFMIAIAESTPGPLGVNMATYVGYTTAGIAGGIIATLGLVCPSVIIALIVARLLYKYKDSALVNSAFSGLRPASVALIAVAGLIVLRMSLLREQLWAQTGEFFDLVDIRAAILAAVLFPLVYRLKAHPVVFLACSAVVGIIFKL